MTFSEYHQESKKTTPESLIFLAFRRNIKEITITMTMAVEFYTSLNRAKAFGIIDKSYTSKSNDSVLVEINSIEEKEDRVIVDFDVFISGKLIKQDKKSYKKDNLTDEEATFLGLAFILTWEEKDNPFSDVRAPENEKQKLKDGAKKFLELAVKEDFRKTDKKSCLPYYFIAKHHLYDYKDRAKTNLHKSLSCPDVFPDAYNVLINLENYSVKKILIAQAGLKKFPSEEKLITEIIDYYVEHEENKKAVDLILSKKEIIPPNEWKNYKSLRLLLVFSLIKLKKFDEAKKEATAPICEDDFEKDANLFLRGFIEYEAGNYQKAIGFFLDAIKIATYSSSEVRASYYFLLGCYHYLGRISQLEELIKEFELNSDYFYVEALRGFHYVENVRKIFKDIIKSEINELAKAKIAGLLAFSYFQEVENDQQSIRNRAFRGGELTKKEKEQIKKSLSYLDDTLKYYPRISFFNALYANLCNHIGDYNRAVIFDLKAIDGKEDENMDAYSYTGLAECSKEFIDSYVNTLKENLLSVETYIKERLGSDVETIKELGRQDIISEIYHFLKKQVGLNKIASLEEESNNRFLFDIAYALKEYGDAKEARNVYEKYIEIDGEDASVLNNLAIIYEKEGNTRQAVSLIKRAKKLSDDNDDIVNRNYARLTSSSVKKDVPTGITEKEQENRKTPKTPETSIDKGIGCFKFYKQGEKIKVGEANSRHFRLLRFLSEPINTAKTIDSVFDAIKIPRDKDDNMLNSYNANQSIGRKIDIISYAIKELQKKKNLKGKLKFELDRNQMTYRLRVL